MESGVCCFYTYWRKKYHPKIEYYFKMIAAIYCYIHITPVVFAYSFGHTIPPGKDGQEIIVCVARV